MAHFCNLLGVPHSCESDAAQRNAGRIHEEVVQHFSSLEGVTVKATLEIEANLPTGASEELIRTITENCRTLRLKSQGFEES